MRISRTLVFGGWIHGEFFWELWHTFTRLEKVGKLIIIFLNNSSLWRLWELSAVLLWLSLWTDSGYLCWKTSWVSFYDYDICGNLNNIPVIFNWLRDPPRLISTNELLMTWRSLEFMGSGPGPIVRFPSQTGSQGRENDCCLTVTCLLQFMHTEFRLTVLNQRE